jgi:hypothetical protein
MGGVGVVSWCSKGLHHVDAVFFCDRCGQLTCESCTCWCFPFVEPESWCIVCESVECFCDE